MQASSIATLTDRVTASGRITQEDVLVLRRAVFGDVKVWPHEAQALFDLAQKRLPSCEEWQTFLVEALTDYIVYQAEPSGYVSDENAFWLMDMVSRDGVVWSDSELELIVHVLDRATTSPAELVRFAISKVKEAVVTGEGPTRRGMTLRPGSIGVAEVDLLRRVLYAVGGGASSAISRAEAEMLFEINDATLGGDNDPSWQDLFVKAIANHVMALSGYVVPTREEALRREAWLAETDVSISGFFGRMVGGWREVLAGYERPGRDLAAQARVNQTVTAGEARWLKERILRNGGICDNQKALLSFIRGESPVIHPELHELLEAAA